MNTNTITPRLLGRSDVRRSAYRVLATVSAITLAFGLTGASWAQPSSRNALQNPTPYLRAFPDRNSVDGGDWPLGAGVHLAIDDPETGEGADYEADATVIVSPWDPLATYVVFDFTYDLKIGDVVKLTSGTLMSEHVVPFLVVTTIDAAEDVIAGNADPYVPVHVFAGQDAHVYTFADSTGAWVADFTEQLDLVPGIPGGVDMRASDGDSAIFDWSVPAPPPTPPPASPWFRVSRDWNYVEAFDWPAGTSVAATVTRPGSSNCGGSGVSSAERIATIPLEEGCTVAGATAVTVSGGGMTKELLATALDVTSFDVAGNHVGGKATPGLNVDIWVNGVENSTMTATPDEYGDWMVDFDQVGYDLEPGAAGRARQADADWDRMVKDWVVPPGPPLPGRFTVFPVADSIHGWDWPEGEGIHLAIDDPSTGPGTDFSDDATVGPAYWDPGQILAVFEFAGVYDVKVGDIVTLSFGSTEATYEVEPISLTNVDPLANTISGTAAEGETVFVWPHGQDWAIQTPTAAPGGAWLADFTATGFSIAGTSGRAEVRDAARNATAVDWSAPVPPSPWLTAFPEWDFVEGFEWPLGTLVHLSLDDPATEISPDLVGEDTAEPSPWGDPRTYVSFQITEGYDLKPGDVVTLTDGVTPRTMVVQDLEITGVDVAEDTVAGKADPGATVNVWPHETGEQIPVAAGEDGLWQVDFDLAYDIVPGSGGRAEIRDALYNGTAVDWYVPIPPNPVFSAYPVDDAVEARFWPPGSQVHLSIDSQGAGGDPEWEQDATIPDGDPNQVWVRMDFAGSYDLVAGDVVTVTDGTTPRTHTVRNLSVTEVDDQGDSVSGTSDPDAEINVWPHETGKQVQVRADQHGAWLASVAPYDIRPGSAGRAEIRDEVGNGTAVEWYVPNPWFTAFPEGEVIEGWDWPLGATVHLTVNDPAVPGDTNFTKDGQVTLSPWGDGQRWLWIEFPGEYDLKAGDFVTLTDGVTERVHTVQELAFTYVNPDENTAYGTASPGMEVFLWSWEDPEGRRLTTAADDYGFWLADFDDEGFDLEPGFHVRAEVWEGVNDTAVDREVRSPRIAVYLESDFVIGWDWTHGANLHLTVDDPTNGESVDFEADTEVLPAPWDPNTWWADFEFAGVYDVKPGDLVTVTDGTTVREHVVLPLTVDEISGAADTAAGTSFAGANVYVHPWDPNTWWFEPVQADEFGGWLMDFTGLYDLLPGTWGIAEVFDEGNNSTAIDWMVPLDIDIRPWSSANLVACGAAWDLLPVAVFSESGFDATGVDHDSVRFGRTGAEAAVVRILGRPLRYARDLNGDGLLDMVYTFRFGDTGFSCADVPRGQSYATVEGILTGMMGDINLEGRDNLTLFRLFGR